MSDERRQTFRCQVPIHDAPAVLRVGTKDMVVQVLEESAGGFSIHAPTLPDLSASADRIALATGGGLCEVRVVHQTETDNGFRIGLERLRDVKGKERQSNLTLLLKALPVAMILIACAVISLWNTGTVQLGWAVAKSEPKIAEPFVRVSAEMTEIEASLAEEFLKLRDFKSMKVGRDLNLTETQQMQICEILKRSSEALAVIYRRRKADEQEDWSEMCLQIIERSREEVLSVLTDEQRTRWLATHEITS